VYKISSCNRPPDFQSVSNVYVVCLILSCVCTLVATGAGWRSRTLESKTRSGRRQIRPGKRGRVETGSVSTGLHTTHLIYAYTYMYMVRRTSSQASSRTYRSKRRKEQRSVKSPLPFLFLLLKAPSRAHASGSVNLFFRFAFDRALTHSRVCGQTGRTSAHHRRARCVSQ
jgi:hypothetical protein